MVVTDQILTSPKMNKRAILSWCFYDWGNSAFSTVILTFVFATYFTEKVAINKIIGTSQWGTAVAIAGLVIAILSPIFGAIADHEGRRKPWLGGFALLAIISAGFLWFVRPSHEYATWTLSWLGLGIVGLEVSVVFYNAMLRDLAPVNYIGRISGWGWGLGYFGGLISLALILLILDRTSIQARIAGPLVGIWYGIFSLPLFIWTPDQPSTGIRFMKAIRLGLRELIKTFRTLPKYKEILKLLLARMIYIDGLNTIFAFGGIYAAGTFGMNLSEVIEFGIAMNIAAGLGAIVFAWVDDYLGAKPTVLISLFIMLALGTSILFVYSKLTFWILGMCLSIFFGPIQAASRSLMVHLVPPHLVTEMFGLYAFSGKATAFMGPWLVGTFTLLFNSQRVGMSVTMFFLLIGGILLCFVKTPP